MATIKIDVYETIERTTEFTFEVPDDMELPENAQDALDILWVHGDSSAIGSDILSDNITTSAVDNLRREV